MSHGALVDDDTAISIRVELINLQLTHAIDKQQLIRAVRDILSDSRFTSANVSLAVVDDGEIHELNRRCLSHDWPTDVLSFVYDERNGHLEGEVVVSADTAAAVVAESPWSFDEELLLYVIHGTLHLVGFRDKTADDTANMRAAEARYLIRLGVPAPDLMWNRSAARAMVSHTRFLGGNGAS